MSDVIEKRLQKILHQLWSCSIQIHTYTPQTTEPYILLKSSSLIDPWTGSYCDHTISLQNMCHPITQEPIDISISYSEEQWSGQLDHWKVAVRGLTKTDITALMPVFDPHSYQDFNPSHYLRPQLLINGVPSYPFGA